MTEQKRWFCPDCQREWLDVVAPGSMPWDPSMGCRACGSQEIRIVTYNAAFPGADMPRRGVTVPVLETVDEVQRALDGFAMAETPAVLAASEPPPVDLWQLI